MSTIRRILLSNCISAYFADYFDYVHYFDTVDKVTDRRARWRHSARCYRQLAAVHLFVASAWAHLSMFLVFYLVPSVDHRTQLMFGNVAIFFGLGHTFNLAVFLVCTPVPMYCLLLFPYVCNYHYEDVTCLKNLVRRELALPAEQREKTFQRAYNLFSSILVVLLGSIIVFITYLNIRVVVYALENEDYFFGGWRARCRLALAMVMVWHLCLCLLGMARTLVDLFAAIFFFSYYTLLELGQCMEWLQRTPFRWSDMDRFRRQHTVIVTRVFRANNIFGNILLMFFAANYPTNAYLLMTIAFQPHTSFLIKWFLAMYMVHQYSFIVFIHLVAAMYR